MHAMARARSRRPGFFTVLRSRPELLVLGGILCVVAAIALVATIGALHNVAPSSWTANDPVLELDTGVRKEAFQDQLLVDLSDVRPMSTTMYGAFFEEINHSGEGGLNPELLRDRSFEARAYLANKYYETRLVDVSANDQDGSAPAPTRRESQLQMLSMDPTTVASANLNEDWAWVPLGLEVVIVQIKPRPTFPKTSANGASSASTTGSASHAHSAATPPEVGADAWGSHGLHALRVRLTGTAGDAPRTGVLVNRGHTMQGFTTKSGSKYVLRLRARSTISESKADGQADAAWGAAAGAEGAKSAAAGGVPTITAQLMSGNGKLIHASQPIASVGSGWTEVRVDLETNSEDANTQLVLSFNAPAHCHVSWDLDWVSLTPGVNWSNDGVYTPYDLTLLQKLQELKPQFLRFPGGAFVEGVNMSTAYRWKTTIGPAEMRPGHPNANWGYWSTDALGLFEFMQLSERLGAEAVWVVNCGISQSESVPPSGLAVWEKDILDSLEFMLGPVSSAWGAVRGAMGRSKPWHLNYVTIGNEECLRPWYKQHYVRIAATVRKFHPHLHLISNCDLGDDAKFDSWEMHSYRPPADTFALREAVDTYSGRPVAVTEFAAMSDKDDVMNAVAEAGFMAALERNCHKVSMVAYAPLLAHAALRTWHPDLLYFDGKGGAYGTPSYYVQRLYRQLAGSYCAGVRLVPSPGVHRGPGGGAAASAGGTAGAGAAAEGGGDQAGAAETLAAAARVAAAAQRKRQQLSHEDKSLEVSATCVLSQGQHCLRLAIKVVNFQEDRRRLVVSAWRRGAQVVLRGTAAAPASGAKDAGDGTPDAGAGAEGTVTSVAEAGSKHHSGLMALARDAKAGRRGGSGLGVFGAASRKVLVQGTGRLGRGRPAAIEVAAVDDASSGAESVENGEAGIGGSYAEVMSLSAVGPGPKSNTFEKPSAVVPRTRRTKVSSAGIMQMLLDPFSLTWVVVDVQA